MANIPFTLTPFSETESGLISVTFERGSIVEGSVRFLKPFPTGVNLQAFSYSNEGKLLQLGGIDCRDFNIDFDVAPNSEGEIILKVDLAGGNTTKVVVDTPSIQPYPITSSGAYIFSGNEFTKLAR